MANQITINIGAAANDGTGDPLRTAFNDVNLNFANVWNTGLPSSNIQFLNNKILTVNTNANLVLAPNGIGIVQSNVDIIPSINRVQSLGSTTKKWNSVNAYYVNADVANIGTIGNFNIDVGNLHISGGSNGYVLQTDGTGNLTWTAQTGGGGNGTPGGANTQVQFNNAGSFGGNANFVFFNGNGALQTAGNVFSYANVGYNLGSPIRYWNNLYVSNVNVSNSIFTLGTVTASAVAVSGDIAANNATIGNITTSQNLYANTGTFFGDQFSDGAIYVGNPAGTVLGSDVVMQITANAAGYSQTNFQNISNAVTASSDYILTADNGNDSTHFLDLGITSSTWNDSETNVLSGLGPNNGYLYVQDGNLTLGTRAGNVSHGWNFDTTGTLTFPDNSGSDWPINTQRFGMGNIGAWLDGQWTIGEFSGNGVSGQVGIRIDPAIEGNTGITIPSQASSTTQPVSIYNTGGGGIELYTGANNWEFNADGTTTFPNNTINPGNGISFTTRTQSSGNAYAIAYQSPNSWEAYAEDDTTGPHNSYAWIKADLLTANTPRVFITNAKSSDGTELTWTFAADGSTVFPTLDTPFGDNPTGNFSGPTLRIGDGINDGIISSPNGTIDNSYSSIVIQPGQGYDDGAGGKTIIHGGRGGPTAGSSGGDVRLFGGYATGGGSGGDIELYIGDSADANNAGAVNIRNTNSDVLYRFNNDGTISPLVKPSNQRTGYGLTLAIGNQDTQAIITGPAPVANTYNSAPRLVVAGQDGVLNGEGGDIYLWAGRSGPDGGSGGDIKVDGGIGYNGSEGGTIKIRGGQGQSGTAGDAYGGFVEIRAGDGNIGAPVVITAGAGNSQATGGNITLTTTYGGQWRFDNYGNLTLPGTTSNINYSNGVSILDSISANTGNVTFNDINIIGTGNLHLQPDPNNSGAYLDIYLTTGPDIHIAKTDSNVIIGADSAANVTVNALGNVSIQSWNGTAHVWDFNANGNLALPANIVNANSRLSLNENGSAAYLTSTTDDSSALYMDTTSAQLYSSSILVTGSGNNGVYIGTSNTRIVQDSADSSQAGNIELRTSLNNQNYTWVFDSTGNLTTPGVSGDISGINTLAAHANLTIQTPSGIPTSVANWNGGGGWNQSLYSDLATTGGTGTGLTVDVAANGGGYINIGAITIHTPGTGYTNGDVITINNENDIPGTFTIGVVNNQWIFDTTGIATLPGEGVLQSIDDSVTLRSLNTTSGNANSVYLGTSGGLGFNDQEIGGNWLEIFRTGTEPEIRVPVGRGNLNIQTAQGNTAYNWVFDDTGNLSIAGSIIMPPNSVLTGTNASPAPSINGFDTISAITFSAVGNITGNTAGYAIGYRDIPQVSFTGNATIATTDAGKHYYSTQSTSYTLTIANNASQGFQVGTAITIVNQGTGNITVAQGSGVTLYIAGNATSGNRSVATFGMATLIKVATDTWFINGTGVS